MCEPLVPSRLPKPGWGFLLELQHHLQHDQRRIERAVTAVSEEDVRRIRELALKLHHLGGAIELPSDVLFALAVATAGEMCTRFPKDQWEQLIIGHVKLLLQMINE